jgi:hypothetical protein
MDRLLVVTVLHARGFKNVKFYRERRKRRKRKKEIL